MSLRLILTRHAKSDWDSPAQPDRSRPLNDRGRAAAPLVARWLAERGAVPTHVLCSNAQRTAETLDLMLGEWTDAPEVRYVGALYHAAAGTILELVRAAAGPTVMVVGHNPGIGTLACALPAVRPTHPAFAKYPTAATAIFGFDAASWRDVRPGQARVLAFAVPRDLGLEKD